MSEMSLATPDLCDVHDGMLATGELRVLAPIFHSFGKKKAFSGPITTLKIFEDNSLVRACLEGPGNGRVLVVDGGGSLRCALLGGDLATLAVRNGWDGIVINGCIRDVVEINACNIGVRALAAHPVKSIKRGQGERDVPLQFGGIRVQPNEFCYADADGVLVSTRSLGHMSNREDLNLPATSNVSTVVFPQSTSFHF